MRYRSPPRPGRRRFGFEPLAVRVTPSIPAERAMSWIFVARFESESRLAVGADRAE
jgi:hypothetical protein